MSVAWKITLNHDGNNEPTLMPNEIKIPDNSVLSMSGYGVTRILRLEKPAKSLSVENVKIEKDLEKEFGRLYRGDPVRIIEIAPVSEDASGN